MIPRRLRPAVAAGAAALAWLLTGTLAAQGPSLEALFDEYAAGHYVALPRTLRTRQDVVAAMRDSANLLDQWRRDWVPVHAAFLLEFSIVGESRGWPGFAATIGSARDLVTHRPQSIGQNAAEDRFELTFHRVAMAFLCGTDTFAAEQYLTAIERRVLPAPPAGGAPALVDARMALARGVARDLRTSPAVQSGRGGLSAPAGSGRDAAAERRNLEDVLRLFDDAARYPAIAAEVQARRAFVLSRLGRYAEAIQALDAAPASDDGDVRYWTALFRGRALDGAERADAAAAAYEQAAAIAPGAQTPLVALAGLRARHHQLDEALRWAAAARSRPADAIDPWWRYWTGDWRFLQAWLADLRQGHP